MRLPCRGPLSPRRCCRIFVRPESAAVRVDVLSHVESPESVFVVQNSVKQRNIPQRHRQIGELTFEADRRRRESALLDPLLRCPLSLTGFRDDEASHLCHHKRTLKNRWQFKGGGRCTVYSDDRDTASWPPPAEEEGVSSRNLVPSSFGRL